MPLTSALLIGSRRSLRLVERNLYVYKHGWLVLLSGFFEPLFYLLSIGFGLGALIGTIPGPGGVEAEQRKTPGSGVRHGAGDQTGRFTNCPRLASPPPRT